MAPPTPKKRKMGYSFKFMTPKSEDIVKENTQNFHDQLEIPALYFGCSPPHQSIIPTTH